MSVCEISGNGNKVLWGHYKHTAKVSNPVDEVNIRLQGRGETKLQAA